MYSCAPHWKFGSVGKILIYNCRLEKRRQAMLAMPQMIQEWKEVILGGHPRIIFNWLTLRTERSWSWLEEVAKISVKYWSKILWVISSQLVTLYNYNVWSTKDGITSCCCASV